MKVFKNVFDRKIPKRNYYLVLMVSILVIVITLYIRSFYLNFKLSNNTNNSIFYDKSINQINTNDMDYAFDETKEAILFVSYNGSKKISNMEKKIYKVFEKRNLIDKVIYLDVSDLKENNKYIKILKERFPNIDYEFGMAPMLVYIKDGQAIEAINSNDRIIDENTLINLLNKYGIV